ncbi:histone deacetylase family protein [Candidatus Woesearchaeota archaeon]|nr:histone deacetylase family protein [Candidatus Woesearchaeota archaeon]
MQLYSHPLFLAQGRDFPGDENSDRLFALRQIIEQAERAFRRGDEENVELIERLERHHSYISDLKVRGPMIQCIDEERETFIDRLSYRTACAAAATSIDAALCEGFALVRPPGHHAHRDFTHGFCLVNNMVIAIEALLENGERPLVLDIDIHHGCGTEELLEEKEDVYMISPYQEGLWPGTNHFCYASNCLHIPLTETLTDRRYQQMFETQVMPAIENWEPSIIGVSLGVDTFYDDKYGGKLSAQTIRRIRQHLKGRRVFGILEGGYTDHSLSEGIHAFLEEP